MKGNTPPIIILGMHRSGTSLLTEVLQAMGLHVGWFLQEDFECPFFLERNEKIMNICGGSWEQPQAVESLLKHLTMRSQMKALLLRDLESPAFLSYLGPHHWRCRGNLNQLRFPWGWKDPRNTYLLPLWLDVFPDAKIVHIYRHPMDVAQSLAVREQNSINQRLRLTGAFAPAPEVPSTLDNGDPRSILLRLYYKFARARNRLMPLRRYEDLAVGSSLSLESGF